MKLIEGVCNALSR